MYEVEMKVEADHAAVERRLEDLDATFAGRVTQVDTYYDAPHRDFAATDEALRIRRETAADADDHGSVGDESEDGSDAEAADGTSVELTYKGPKVDEGSKTRREIETLVEDPDAADDILEALGFEPAAEVRKERRRYRLEGHTVTLDEVADVGEFVEVETHAEDVERARDGVAALLGDLGLDPDDQVRTSYLGLLLADEGA